MMDRIEEGADASIDLRGDQILTQIDLLRVS